MIECVIIKAGEFFYGYIKDKQFICAFGEDAADVVESLLYNLEVYDYVTTEIELEEILKELNIQRHNESDESTTS